MDREIWHKDKISCAAPRAIASAGMPKTTQLSSSWAMVREPARLSASKPWAQTLWRYFLLFSIS
jgi:hypothetical protein